MVDSSNILYFDPADDSFKSLGQTLQIGRRDHTATFVADEYLASVCPQ